MNHYLISKNKTWYWKGKGICYMLTNFMPSSYALYRGCERGGNEYPLLLSGTKVCWTNCAYRHLVNVT